MTKRGKGGLSPEDATLWEAVRRTIRPLRSTKGKTPESPDRQAADKGRQSPKPSTAFQSRAQHPKEALAPEIIERKEWRRIAAGKLAIGRRLDLHGKDRQSAHRLVNQALRQARDDGIRVVLVVTGKGTARAGEGGTTGESGVLKRELPHWLSSGSLRAIVRAFGEAHARHGGAGATYVLLRRKKK